jgi:hypothetical protein
MPKNSSTKVGCYSEMKVICPCGWEHASSQTRDCLSAQKRHNRYCLISKQYPLIKTPISKQNDIYMDRPIDSKK